MTPAAPIPASLATACAAHDRHRLDVLDALLDETAPSAVRELLGAALDLCASMRTRRDETEADLASERAHLAACRTRIAGLEQAADERSKEVARLTTERDQALADDQQSLSTWLRLLKAIDPKAESTEDALRAVARLTARVAELEAADRAIKITPTLLAAALVGSRDGSVTPAAAAQAERLLSLAGELFIAPPTSPPAARPVFAGVSVEELARVFWCATGRGYKPEQWETLAPSTQAEWIKGTAAVLARLEVSLVAPVDPEVVARRYHDHKESPVPEWPYAADHDINSPIDADHEQARLRATAAMRATLTAAGIPVTPEVGK